MTSVLTAIFFRICETLFSFLSSAGGDDLTLTFVMSYEIRNSSSSSRNRQTSTAAAARCTSNGLPDSFQHELEASLATSLYIRLSWVRCDGLDTRLCLFLVYFVCCSKVETKRYPCHTINRALKSLSFYSSIAPLVLLNVFYLGYSCVYIL